MDIVITTALIPGRPAPKLWTEDMVRMMKPGSSSSTLRPNAAATAT
jgi:NAD/NADP transhydrogenase alpha subunit